MAVPSSSRAMERRRTPVCAVISICIPPQIYRFVPLALLKPGQDSASYTEYRARKYGHQTVDLGRCYSAFAPTHSDDGAGQYRRATARTPGLCQAAFLPKKSLYAKQPAYRPVGGTAEIPMSRQTSTDLPRLTKANRHDPTDRRAHCQIQSRDICG